MVSSTWIELSALPKHRSGLAVLSFWRLQQGREGDAQMQILGGEGYGENMEMMKGVQYHQCC
jgi:hypothetical protein